MGSVSTCDVTSGFVLMELLILGGQVNSKQVLKISELIWMLMSIMK